MYLDILQNMLHRDGLYAGVDICKVQFFAEIIVVCLWRQYPINKIILYKMKGKVPHS